jgi:CRP/FNR family transcriptional regulator
VTAHHPGTSCVAIVPLFADLTPQEQDEVATIARPLRRSRGESIHRAGEAVSHLLVVHRGRIRISHVAPSGHEQLIRVLEPGDFVGEASFVTGSRPDDHASALTDVELCSFDHRDLRELVTQHPDIALRMLHAVTTRLETTERMLSDLTSSDVEARLAGYLLDLPARRSEQGAAGRLEVDLPLAKKDVASLLGTTPETLSRKLALFAEQGLVVLGGRTIGIVDPDGLEARAGSQ